jgi:hypothetical protein
LICFSIADANVAHKFNYTRLFAKKNSKKL